jgi:hypothetical protein
MASRQSGGRAPALALSRRLRTPREPTGTALDRHEVKWQGRCCHKRRLEYRLMVRRRDPKGLRRRGPRVRKNFRVNVKVKKQYCRVPPGIAAMSRS